MGTTLMARRNRNTQHMIAGLIGACVLFGVGLYAMSRPKPAPVQVEVGHGLTTFLGPGSGLLVTRSTEGDIADGEHPSLLFKFKNVGETAMRKCLVTIVLLDRDGDQITFTHVAVGAGEDCPHVLQPGEYCLYYFMLDPLSYRLVADFRYSFTVGEWKDEGEWKD